MIGTKNAFSEAAVHVLPPPLFFDPATRAATSDLPVPSSLRGLDLEWRERPPIIIFSPLLRSSSEVSLGELASFPDRDQKMPSLVKRRFTFFLLVFSLIQLPEQPPPTFHCRLACEESTWNGGSDLQLSSSFLSPQSVCYGLVLLTLLVLGLLATVDLIFKSVFVVCSLAVHWATSNCRISRPGKLECSGDR